MTSQNGQLLSCIKTTIFRPGESNYTLTFVLGPSLVIKTNTIDYSMVINDTAITSFTVDKAHGIIPNLSSVKVLMMTITLYKTISSCFKWLNKAPTDLVVAEKVSEPQCTLYRVVNSALLINNT